MSIYTNQEIDQLIACPKRMLNPPRKELKPEGAHLRQDFHLEALDETIGEFHVFLRKHAEYQENFTIGLTYRPRDGRPEVTLLRCNGAHGPYNGTIGDPGHPHWGYHIHKASEESIANSRRAESHAEPTAAYASFEQALTYFLSAVQLNREDRQTYFPGIDQLGLFS